MENSKVAKTLMSTATKLDKDEDGIKVDQKHFRGMIGSLLYLTGSKPNIMFSVCLCARFHASPRESHLIVIKRIFRYLQGSKDYGLFFPRNSTLDLVVYSDVDFAGCKMDRKSTSVTCQFFGHSLVSWFNKKQNSVALSTTEAEYIATGCCCAQVLWMRQTLKDFDLSFTTTPILCDNTSARNLSKNPVHHSRTKHIEVRHHFLRDHVVKNDVKLELFQPKIN